MINNFLRGKDVVLASNSPRRKELMGLLCDNFRVVPSDADEIIPDDISLSFKDKAAETAVFLAEIKAQDVARDNYTSVVFGCDTVVAVGDEIMGKPKDDDDAFAMLRTLSGRTHRVISGVCICFENQRLNFFEETFVKFRELSDDEIISYVNTNEPHDKAGAYGIQGFGALLCEGINGDFFNVVGFPVSRINAMLCELEKRD